MDLYGGGGGNSVLEASVLSCDRAETCSFFKNDTCLNIRRFGGTGCKFGEVRNVRGYTQRAQKYMTFKKKWQDHDKYGKLSLAKNKLGLIGDVIVFPYPYVNIEEYDGKLVLRNPGFSNGKQFISKEEFTLEFIKEICEFKPQAMMGGTIAAYEKEVIPLFLAHLKEVIPTLYEEFSNKYTEYSEKVNYVGREALLHTLNPSTVYYTSRRYPKFNEEWEWDGEYLTYKNGYVRSFNIAKEYEEIEIRLKPTTDTVIKITEETQVNENTKYVD